MTKPTLASVLSLLCLFLLADASACGGSSTAVRPEPLGCIKIGGKYVPIMEADLTLAANLTQPPLSSGDALDLVSAAIVLADGAPAGEAVSDYRENLRDHLGRSLVDDSAAALRALSRQADAKSVDPRACVRR